MNDVNVVHIRHNILHAVLLPLRSVSQQRRVLRLSKSELVMDQNPGRFIMHLVASLYLLLGELTPCAFAHDAANLKMRGYRRVMTYVVVGVETFGLV